MVLDEEEKWRGKHMEKDIVVEDELYGLKMVDT